MVGRLFTLTLSATDPDGDAIALSVANAPVGHAFTDNRNGTGTFTWTPASNQLGSHSFMAIATDSGNPMATAMADVVVTVGPAANQPPVLAPVGDRQVDVGVLLTISLSASDPEGAALTYSVDPLPSGATLTGNLFAWTPGPGQVGNHAVTYAVTDAGTPPQSDSEMAVITVGDVNRPPLLSPIGNRLVVVGQTARIALTASDADGDALRLECSGLPGDARFTDLGDGTGEIAWTPAMEATYAVTCTATDDGNPPEMASETFMLTAAAPLPPPTAPAADAPVLESAAWQPDSTLKLKGYLGGSAGAAAQESDGDESDDETDQRDSEDDREARDDDEEDEVPVDLYAVLADGTHVLLGSREKDHATGSFSADLKPFIAPCQVAAGVQGSIGQAVAVANAPADCDQRLLLEVKQARLSCEEGTLELHGRRAPAQGLVIASDPGSGAALLSVPVTRDDGKFKAEGKVAGSPRELSVRAMAGQKEWTLERRVPVAFDDDCEARQRSEERASSRPARRVRRRD
jgi:hypothetical protein